MGLGPTAACRDGTARRLEPAPTGGMGEPGSGNVHRLPFLSIEEERDLALRSRAGDVTAETKLVLSHLRLVRKLARFYGRFGASLPDLVQEGTIGLIHAVRRFDPHRDNRLSTYAMWWIRAAMQEHVVRSWSLVRLGKSAAHRALFFSLRRGGPTDAKEEAVMAKPVEKGRLPAAEIVAMIRRLSAPDLSLDTPLRGGLAEETIGDRLPAEMPSPEEDVADRSLQGLWTGMLVKALSLLPDREAHIIRVRHLADPAPTFDAIGKDLGISKDRVRQLEQRALARLRTLLGPAALAHGLPGR